MTRIEFDVADSGDTVLIPGYWREEPKVGLFMKELDIYNKDYPNQNQKLKIEVTNIKLQPYTGTVSVTNGSPNITGVGTYWNSGHVGAKFTVDSDGGVYTISLVNSPESITLSTNYTGTTSSGESYTIKTGVDKYQFDVVAQHHLTDEISGAIVNEQGSGVYNGTQNSSVVTGLAANTREVTVHVRLKGCYGTQENIYNGEGDFERCENKRYEISRYVKLYYYTNGAWQSVNTGPKWCRGGTWSDFTCTASSSYDITQIYIQSVYNNAIGDMYYYNSCTTSPGCGSPGYALTLSEWSFDSYSSELVGGSTPLAVGSVLWLAINK